VKKIVIPFTNYEPGVLDPLVDYMGQFGAVHILHPSQKPDYNIDLLVLPYGPDMAFEPSYFANTYPLTDHQRTCPHLQYFFEYLLYGYIQQEVPIFGICLGFQMLAAQYNSILTTPAVGHDTKQYHAIAAKAPLRYIMNVDIKKDALYYVNSSHHIAVAPQDLGEELIPLAYSVNSKAPFKKEVVDDVAFKIPDNLEFVECFRHYALKIAAVQWHPERIKNRLKSRSKKKTGLLIGDILANSLINEMLNDGSRLWPDRGAHPIPVRS